MLLEFADTEQYRAFIARYPNFDSSFDRLIALTNKIFARRIKKSNLLHDLVFSIGETCRDEFADIIFLGANGHGSAASKMLRGLYERAVTLAYLRKHPEKARRFINYTAINEYKMIMEARKFYPDDAIDSVMGPENKVVDIVGRYKEHRAEFRTKNGVAGRWDVSFADQVKDIGEPYQGCYLMGYLLPTMHIHATGISVFSRYTTSVENETIQREQPDHQEILVTLVHAHALLLQVLKEQIDTFELALSSDFEECAAALLCTWNLGANDAEGFST